jgi:hypothetical protein
VGPSNSQPLDCFLAVSTLLADTLAAYPLHYRRPSVRPFPSQHQLSCLHLIAELGDASL